MKYIRWGASNVIVCMPLLRAIVLAPQPILPISNKAMTSLLRSLPRHEYRCGKSAPTKNLCRPGDLILRYLPSSLTHSGDSFAAKHGLQTISPVSPKLEVLCCRPADHSMTTIVEKRHSRSEPKIVSFRPRLHPCVRNFSRPRNTQIRARIAMLLVTSTFSPDCTSTHDRDCST